MKCKNCNCSVASKMLHRTNSFGQSNAGWMCMDCITKTHPELAKNIIQDNEGGVLSDLNQILNNKVGLI
jgi:Zn-finger protein